ncbi:MAG: hypothetical protein AMXMBFR64_57060 [Myxococcales bacterium]
MTTRLLSVLCLFVAAGCAGDATGGAGATDVASAGDAGSDVDSGASGPDAAADVGLDAAVSDDGGPTTADADGTPSPSDVTADVTDTPADVPYGDSLADAPPVDAEPTLDAADSAQPVDVTWPPDGSAPPFVVLDPSTLTFFTLPIGSIRHAVAGHDPSKHICATLIWDFSNNGEPPVAHCGMFYQGFPYAIIETDTDGPCGAWDYGSDLVTGYAAGCVDFAAHGPASMDLIEVNVHVESDAASWVIHANNLGLYDPPPAFFGIEYSTDIPEDVWALAAGPDSVPGWVKVTKDGAPIRLFPHCGVPRCDGGPTPPCGQPDVVVSLTGGDYSGSIHAAWDGRIREIDEALGCQTATVAPDGAYEATLCFSWTVEGAKTGQGPSVQCKTVPFTIPIGELSLTWIASFGG